MTDISSSSLNTHHLSSGRWSPAEDAILLANQSLENRRLPALLPSRTRKAIEHRRVKLRALKSEKRRWSREEDKMLRAKYASEDTAALAGLLGHSVDATHKRAWRLGVRKQSILLKPRGVPLLDELRKRAAEDGFSLADVGREIGIRPNCIRGDGSNYLNIQRLVQAVEFFGGTVEINWRDE
jgi:hypothetical protein